MPYLKLSFNHSPDSRECQNSKSGLRDPHMTTFDLIFRVRTHSIRLRAKFEVSSFNHSRGIKGVQKILKVGHETTTWLLLT